LLLFSGIMSVLNVVLLLIMVPKYDIVGAAWAYLISVIPVVVMLYWTDRYILRLTRQIQFYLPLLVKLLVTTIIYIVFVKFAVLPFMHHLIILVVAGPISVVIFFLLFYLFGFFDAEDEVTIRSFVKKLIRMQAQKIGR